MKLSRPVVPVRPRTYAFCGGAFGDEGKGRIVDQVVSDLAAKGPVVVYRDNGGANAGHTVEFANGQRVALHQLPSGVFVKGATVVLGKEMVLHPGDLLEELAQTKAVTVVRARAKILIDEMALLALDTHRVYENVLKRWLSGGTGSTGRGISPAYADVLLRFPLRMRDIADFDAPKIKQHYDLYEALIAGLGADLANEQVPTLSGKMVKVGSRATFLKRLRAQGESLKGLVKNVYPFLIEQWADAKCGFVFEKAQALGLDYRWGVYPDITASDTSFDGIFSATEAIIDPDLIGVKAGVIKATYMSSVGSRRLPTLMEPDLAAQIREDASEYGATTKRPRDIAYLDIPALKYFVRVGRFNALVLTHMDISYKDRPVYICTEYKRAGKTVAYRPDQAYLDTVKPVYQELTSWDPEAARAATTLAQLPADAKKFIKVLEELLGVPVIVMTTGPRRDQTIWVEKLVD